ADQGYDLLFHRNGVLARRNSHIDKQITKWTRASDPFGTANLHDLGLRNDRAAGELHRLALLVLHGPCFDGCDDTGRFREGVGILLNGFAALKSRCVNFPTLDSHLEPGGAALGLDDTEAGGFTDQRIVRNHPAVYDPFRAETFSRKVDSLMLIDGRVAGFKSHRGESQIAL